jgi:hypothetical protein
VVPSVPEGWITLAVPAGTHAVRVWLGDTWPRQWGGALSVVALLGVLAWAGWALWRRPDGRLPSPPGDASRGPGMKDVACTLQPLPPAQRVPARLAWLLGGCVVVGLLARAAADPYSAWRMKPDPLTPPPAQYPVFVPLDAHLALAGYDLPQASAPPGGSFAVTLYWEAVAPATRNLRAFVHLLGADGKLWGQSDHFHPGGLQILATSRWPVYRYVVDAHTLVVDPAAPPGVYTLRTGLWDGMTGERMHVLDAGGQPTDQDGVVLTGHFVVTANP